MRRMGHERCLVMMLDDSLEPTTCRALPGFFLGSTMKDEVDQSGKQVGPCQLCLPLASVCCLGLPVPPGRSPSWLPLGQRSTAVLCVEEGSNRWISEISSISMTSESQAAGKRAGGGGKQPPRLCLPSGEDSPCAVGAVMDGTSCSLQPWNSLLEV